MNNGFDTALGPCQTHYSPVNEEGRMKIPGEAIIRPVHGNYTALCLLTESALLYKNVNGKRGKVLKISGLNPEGCE